MHDRDHDQPPPDPPQSCLDNIRNFLNIQLRIKTEILTQSNGNQFDPAT